MSANKETEELRMSQEIFGCFCLFSFTKRVAMSHAPLSNHQLFPPFQIDQIEIEIERFSNGGQLLVNSVLTQFFHFEFLIIRFIVCFLVKFSFCSARFAPSYEVLCYMLMGLVF